jgi:hypothetical protein
MQQMNTMNNMNNKMHELNELNHNAKNAQAYAWYVNKERMILASNAMDLKLHIKYFIKRCKSIANILTTTISNL